MRAQRCFNVASEEMQAKKAFFRDPDLFTGGPLAINHNLLRRIFSELVPVEATEELMVLLALPGLNEDMRRALPCGMVVGILAGASKILVQSLEKRFGAVPEPFRASIFNASIKQLETWAERAVEAPDLASVFDPADESSAEEARKVLFSAEMVQFIGDVFTSRRHYPGDSEELGRSGWWDVRAPSSRPN